MICLLFLISSLPLLFVSPRPVYQMTNQIRCFSQKITIFIEKIDSLEEVEFKNYSGKRNSICNRSWNSLCGHSLESDWSIKNYVFVYLPPSSSRNDCQNLFSSLSGMIEITYAFLILGDFNYPDINWKNLTFPSSDRGEIFQKFY